MKENNKKQEKLAEQLRQNLLKRKQQARLKKENAKQALENSRENAYNPCDLQNDS